MPSSLSYQTGYLGARRYQVPFTREDLVDPINKDVFEDFNKYTAERQAAIAEAKKKKEEERQRLLAQHKEMRSEVDAASTVKLYDGDYSLYQEIGNWLNSDEVINQYASTQEGMQQWMNMVQQYHDSIGLGEQYYDATWGSAEDQKNPTLSTYNAAYFRSLTPDVNYYENISMRSTKGWDQIEAAHGQLNQQYHVPGSVRFENGKIVYDTIDGKTVALGTEQRDMDVFNPNLTLMDVSGWDYISKFDDGKLQDKKMVEDLITNDTRDIGTQTFKHMVEHYLRSENMKATYDDVISSNAQNVMSDNGSGIIANARQLWIEEALKAWRRPKVTKTGSRDMVAERQAREKREKIQNLLDSTVIIQPVGGGLTTPPSSQNVPTTGEAGAQTIMEQYLGESPKVPGTSFKVPSVLETPITVSDGGENYEMLVTSWSYDVSSGTITLAGTTTKSSTTGVQQTMAPGPTSITLTPNNGQELTELDNALLNEYEMSLEDFFRMFVDGKFRGLMESGVGSSASANQNTGLFDSIGQ